MICNTACSPVDEDYGVSSKTDNKESTVSYPKNIKIPSIKSEDTVMPLYFDISLYDEENYSKIYLGKRYEFNAVYDGKSLEVPTDLEALSAKGWEISPNEKYTSGSIIKAGSTLYLQFINEEGTLLTGYFYNESDKLVKLKDCKIVRLVIKENYALNADSQYGEFNINGVSNLSAVTDVIQSLGAPSHFHADSATDYTLNWFKTAKDRRNKITVKISTETDSVTYIAISDYK